MTYHLYEVYYKLDGHPGVAKIQGVDITSAVKLFSQAYPDRFITMVVYEFSFFA